MFSERELALLDHFSGEAQSPEASSSASISSILGRNFANLPSNAINSLLQSAVGVADMGASPEEKIQPWQVPQVMDPPQLGADATTGQKITDILSGTIAPEIAALLVPYLGISKVARAAGAGPVLASTIANIGQGAFAGAKYGPDEAARFAVTGGLLAPIGAVPGVLRRAALAGGVGAADYAYLRSQGESQGTAGTSAAVDLLAGMIPMHLGGKAAEAIEDPVAKLPQLRAEIASLQNDLNPTVQKKAYLAQLQQEIEQLQTQILGNPPQHDPLYSMLPKIGMPEPPPANELRISSPFQPSAEVAQAANQPGLRPNFSLTGLSIAPEVQAAQQTVAAPSTRTAIDELMASLGIARGEAGVAPTVPEALKPSPELMGKKVAAKMALSPQSVGQVGQQVQLGGINMPTGLALDPSISIPFERAPRGVLPSQMKIAAGANPIQQAIEEVVPEASTLGMRVAQPAPTNPFAEIASLQSPILDLPGNVKDLPVQISVPDALKPGTIEIPGAKINSSGNIISVEVPKPAPRSSFSERLQIAEDAAVPMKTAKGKLSPLPEYRRTEGGLLGGDSEILKTVLASGIGGLAGGAIGGQLGGKEGAYTGAALGLVGPWGVKAAQQLLRGEAVKLGSFFSGMKSETGAIGDILESFLKGKNVTYNGAMEEAHLFTLKDESSKAYGATFAVLGEVTEESLASKIQEVRQRFGDPVASLQTEVKPSILSEKKILAPKLENTEPKLGLKPLETNVDSAFATRELVLPLAGAAVGAVTGYSKDETEGAIAGAILGFAGGLGVSRFVDSLERISPALATPGKATGKTVSKLAKGGFEGVKKALNRPIKDLAGEDVNGRGGILSKVARVLEDQFRMNMPEDLKTAITRARGAASEIVDYGNNALKAAIRFSPPEDILKVTNQFLDGQLITAKEELEFLTKNGGLAEDAFKKLTSSEKENFTKWTTKNAAYKSKTETPNIEEFSNYFAPKGTRGQFLKDQEATYLKSVPEEWRDFAKLQIAARRAMTQFQSMIGDALPTGSLKERLEDSLGRYVPRQYRVFTDSKYAITDDQIQSAMREYGLTKSSREIEAASARGLSYPEADYNAQIAKLQSKTDLNSQGRLARLATFVPTEVDGKKYFASSEIEETIRKFGNEDYLRNAVHSYLSDLKGNRQMMGSRGIDKSLFLERDDIGPAFRDMLGEYTDPVERMAMGLQKMYAPSQAAKLISMARKMEVDGIPIALSGDKWAAMNSEVRAALMATTDLAEIASLQSKLSGLNAYKKLPNDIKFGEYSGLHVNRFLSDYFNDSSSAIWETGIGRGMAEFNRFFKTAHIPLNPVTQLRQLVSMPVFAMIGRANPASMGQAFTAYKDLGSGLRKELIREGVWTADFIRGELSGNVSSILNGRYDSALVKGLKKGYENVLEVYRIPDMIVRGGTYISAKNRIAGELGLALDHPEVIQKAVAWTDRYTMNYDNISKFVQTARNVPFVNPFISFQAEMLRIMKNFAVDGFSGDFERLAKFSGLLALPVMAGIAAEQSLSEEDRKEWFRTKALLPPYMRDSSLLPIARLQNGKFKYVSISPIIPQDNFIQAAQAAFKGDAEAFATVNPFLSTQNSPLFNAISELVSGEDKRTGLRHRNAREALGSVISEILPPLSPGGYEWNKIANVNVENLKSGKVEDWGDLALRYSTGLSSGVLQPESVIRSAQSKLKRDISDLRQRFQRIAQTTRPEEDKAQAYEEYRSGVSVLIQDFSEKVQ